MVVGSGRTLRAEKDAENEESRSALLPVQDPLDEAEAVSSAISSTVSFSVVPPRSPPPEIQSTPCISSGQL